MSPVRRVGVFGGAFDPPHAAHLALAQAAIRTLALDELRVVPTGNAWHKVRVLTDARHRLAMAELAFAALPQVVVDPRETRRGGPSYTVETLRELRALEPTADLFLVVGEDQACALTSWQAWEEILQLAIICVADRGDPTGVRAGFVAPQAHKARFRRVPMPPLPISATHIRTQIAARSGVPHLVCDAVARYIADHHLYQTT